MRDIKTIDPTSITTVGEVDEAIFEVEKALATIRTQIDFETVGGSKDIKDLVKTRQDWLLRARASERFTAATLTALQSRREVLWDEIDITREGTKNEQA